MRVTVVLHEIDGHQVEVSQTNILSEGFARQCAQSTLQTYNQAHKTDTFPIPVTDVKLYNSLGTLIYSSSLQPDLN